MNLEIAARQLEALGSPVRLKIYRALVRAGDDGLRAAHFRPKWVSLLRLAPIIFDIS